MERPPPQSGMAAPGMDPPPPPGFGNPRHVHRGNGGGAPTSLRPPPRTLTGTDGSFPSPPGGAPSAHTRTETAGPLSPSRGRAHGGSPLTHRGGGIWGSSPQLPERGRKHRHLPEPSGTSRRITTPPRSPTGRGGREGGGRGTLQALPETENTPGCSGALPEGHGKSPPASLRHLAPGSPPSIAGSPATH